MMFEEIIQYDVFSCLVAGILHFFGQFRGQLEVLAMAKIHPLEDYFPQKTMFYCQTFFLLQIFSLLDCFQQIPEKKFGGHGARLREKENLFRYRAQFKGNLLRFVRARAHVHALMTCAVGMHNAILRNFLKPMWRSMA